MVSQLVRETFIMIIVFVIFFMILQSTDVTQIKSIDNYLIEHNDFLAGVVSGLTVAVYFIV